MARLKTMPARLGSAPARVRAAPKVADALYLSPEWRKLMAVIIAERGRRCEDCGAQGVRVFGDHIIEVRDGGASLDKRNVRLRCGSCHQAKTAKARAERAAGRTYREG